MKLDYSTFFVLLFLPFYVHGKQNSRLWTVNDDKTDFTNQVFSYLTDFAKYCCEKIHKQTTDKCNHRQMGYWAFIPNNLNNKNLKINWLRQNFDPKIKNNKEQLQMCNCVLDSNGKCQPFTNGVQYPLFSFGQGKSDTHSEQILLPKMAYSATVLPQKVTFYLYSLNSPCSRDLGGTKSCMTNIFKFANENLYQKQTPFHKMSIGFKNWYVYQNSITQARKLFCLKTDHEKQIRAKNGIDFTNVLKFQKIWKFNGDAENKMSDDDFVKTLGNNEC